MASTTEIPRPKAQRGYIDILVDRCKGCDLCIPACPVEIIEKYGPGNVNWMGWLPVRVSDEEMKYRIAAGAPHLANMAMLGFFNHILGLFTVDQMIAGMEMYLPVWRHKLLPGKREVLELVTAMDVEPYRTA
jgi:ferredoxin